MTTEQRTNVVNIAAGLCFVGFGVLLLLQTNGLLDMRTVVKSWPVAIIVIGGAVVAQAMRGDGFRGVPVGGLVWIVLLGLLFSYTFDRRTAGESAPSDQINVFAVLGGDNRPPLSGEFHGGRLTTVMGGSNLDLRQTNLAPGQTAVIDMFAVMGGTQIRVPPTWRVESETIAIMGGINLDRANAEAAKDQPKADAADAQGQAGTTGSFAADAPAAPAPRLLLRGTVIMAGVTVKR